MTFFFKFAPPYHDFFGIDFEKGISECRDLGTQLSEGICLAHCHQQWRKSKVQDQNAQFSAFSQLSKVAGDFKWYFLFSLNLFFFKSDLTRGFSFSNAYKFFAFLPGSHMQAPPHLSRQSNSGVQHVLLELQKLPLGVP